jgi:polysaccharide export outer membrane protein
LTQWAEERKILVIRKEIDKEMRITLNYKKAIKGDPSSNLVLKSGDTIIVPSDEKAPLKEETEAKSTVDKESYVIGPEDVLYIHVWKEDALSKTLPVRMDGNISLPLIHQIRAAGLTPLQLEDVIVEKLRGYYENPPMVTVAVMETNSFKVYVTGEVKTPGVYKLRDETSILQIIAMAGGLTQWAKERKILVIRKEMGKETRITLNYKKAIKGDPSSNLVLKSGDTVIVP